MHLLVAAAATPDDAAIDPTTLALLSIFGGVIVTALVGLIGAWIQSTREHSRWIRERRLDAYIRFLGVVQAFEAERVEAAAVGAEIKVLAQQNDETHRRYEASTDPHERATLKKAGDEYNAQLDILIKLSERASERVRVLRESLAENSVPFGLLGPRAVQEFAVVVDASDDENAYSQNMARLHGEMRRALGIRD